MRSIIYKQKLVGFSGRLQSGLLEISLVLDTDILNYILTIKLYTIDRNCIITQCCNCFAMVQNIYFPLNLIFVHSRNMNINGILT